MSKYIPSLFTLANVTCGFIAISIGQIMPGVLFLFLGIFFDGFDGILARALNAQTELGKELDSLADVITFGVAPAFLYLTIAPMESWVAYIGPVIFLLGDVLRLAKFNTLPSSKYFIGMPVPVATMFIIGLLLGYEYAEPRTTQVLANPFFYTIIPIVVSILMNSSIKMFSLKGIKDGIPANIFQLSLFVIFCLLIYIDFRIACSSIVIIYLILSLAESRLSID